MHLAAIVGDPACARDPELAQEVNVDASRGARAPTPTAAGVERFVFASTCSNYGRMADPTVPIDRGRRARARSRSTPSRRSASRRRCSARDAGAAAPTCLRFATVYGVAPRMRFDLTVNEFTRDLWADRDLEVFGEQFWRPYVHVRDAARGVRTVLEAPADDGRPARSSTSADSRENYRKLDLVELIRTADRPRRGRATCTRDEDPRDYKVSFDKIRAELGFETPMTVSPTASREIIDGARRRGPLRRPVRCAGTGTSASRSRSSTSGSTPEDIEAVPRRLRVGLADAWARARPRSRRRSPSTSACGTRSPCRAAPPRCTSPTWPPASARATR